MVPDYSERLAIVRSRFAAGLESKVDKVFAVVPSLSAGTPAATAIGAVNTAYRGLHDIVGIGPAVGFVATGQAARTAENILLRPQRDERALTAQEIDLFKKSLHGLRETARRELQNFRLGR